jgi:DNA-binding CsgD family transcriptional regulator
MGDVPGISPRRSRLTRRQEQVVDLAANGMSDKEMARQLGISVRTVEDHFSRARQRWGAATRAELIAMAVASGTIVPARVPGGWAGAHDERSGWRSETMRFPNKMAAAHGHSAGVPAVRQGQENTTGLPVRRRPGRPTVMTRERIAAARELLRNDTVTRVARKLGVGRTTLYAHLGRPASLLPSPSTAEAGTPTCTD